MRRLLLLTLLPTLAFAERAPVIAVLPPKAPDAAATRLGLLMEARALALLVQSGQTVLDTKQVLAMASQEGLDVATLSDDVNADKALSLLGADRVVTVVLTAEGVEGSVRDGKQSTYSVFKVKEQSAHALLSAGSDAIARAVLHADPPRSAQPESKSDAALTSLGTCWELALKQPMGIDAPVGLSAADLDAGLSACRAALKADPSLRFASATQAMLLAIGREDAEAEKLLGPQTATDPALMPWALAHYWLATRNQSNEAAVTFLTKVLEQHPGSLILRSFHANTLAAMNEHARAIASWNDYLALSPSSAFALGRQSRSLARQDKLDLALAAAKKGLTLTPQSREARLAVASRQLDAGKVKDAKATLQPLTAMADVPAEPLLRVALVLLDADDCKSASPLLQAASERAAGPRAGRTKGRALYGLAVCEAKQGHAEPAKAAYTKALETGFRAMQLDPALAKLVKTSAPDPEATPEPSAGRLYLRLQPVPASDLIPLVEKLMHTKLEALGAAFAPEGEDKKAALAAIKANHLKGFQLGVTLEAGEAPGSMKVQLLVMSYPEQALKGSWSVKASGGKPEKLVAAMVNRVVDDAAGDLDWKN
ncbi:MAG: hypothetical protein GQE15_28685 [Archangiaceae bacterium]|nr:hypothetical protein [Archangiaceae bacterium]